MKHRLIKKIGLLFLLNLSWVAWVHAGNPANGAKIYQRYCESCHGSSGRSLTPGTPDFSVGESLNQPDGVLQAAVEKGKKMMPGFLGILKKEQIQDAISYLRTLQ